MFRVQRGYGWKVAAQCALALLVKMAINFDQLGKRYLQKDWLRAHPAEARRLFWRNPSFIFFRKISHIGKRRRPYW